MADNAEKEYRVGLQELEPSPVEETPAESNSQDSYFPPPSHTSALGLSQHSTVWCLTRIQKYSSIVFSAFAVAHIANTSLIPLATRSVPTSEPYLLLTRPYYQSWPIAEPLLIIVPLALHVGSGIALRVYRRNVNARKYGAETRRDRKRFSAKFWPVVSGISKLGYLGMYLVAGHAFVNRMLPATLPGGSSNINLGYVSHAFAKHPAVSLAGYTALISVASWHIVWGWAKWLGLTPDQLTEVGQERQIWKKRRWYIVNGVAASLAALWIAGGLGVVGRAGEVGGWVGREYDEIYRKLPLVGQWM